MVGNSVGVAVGSKVGCSVGAWVGAGVGIESLHCWVQTWKIVAASLALLQSYTTLRLHFHNANEGETSSHHSGGLRTRSLVSSRWREARCSTRSCIPKEPCPSGLRAIARTPACRTRECGVMKLFESTAGGLQVLLALTEPSMHSDDALR